MTPNPLAAPRVAAQQSCAESRPAEAPAPCDQPSFAPLDRWALLELVTPLRKRLRLTAGDIGVLRALLSFLPVRQRGGRDLPVTPQVLTVVFASNQAIAARAGGIDERVLRHAVRRLCAAGLLVRRDSASGKRFALRRGGRIVAAYGLDLAPGFVAAPLLRRQVAQQVEEAETVRALRARLFARRREILSGGRRLCQEMRDWLEGLSTLLRRQLSPATLQELSAEMARLEAETASDPIARGTEASVAEQPASDAPAKAAPEEITPRESLPETHGTPSQASEETLRDAGQSPACDGKNDRHRESIKIDKHTPRGLHACWRACTELQGYFPEAPRSAADLRDILCRVAQMLRISPDSLARGIATLGWEGLAQALNAMAERACEIRNPSAYLLALSRDIPRSHSAFPLAQSVAGA